MTFPKFKSDGTIKRLIIKKSELEIYLIAIYETWIHFRWGQMCAEGLGCNQADGVNTQIKCLQELPVDNIVESGFIDTFRLFNNDADHYTWWSYMFNSRKRNIGCDSFQCLLDRET